MSRSNILDPYSMVELINSQLFGQAVAFCVVIAIAAWVARADPRTFSMFSVFDFEPLFTCINYHAWIAARNWSSRVQVLPCLLVVLLCYTFGFSLSWTASCFYEEPWIDFLDKRFMGRWKVHFNDVVCCFRLILAIFKTKSTYKMEKINARLGLTTLK